MDLGGITQSKISQTERQIPDDLTYMRNLKEKAETQNLSSQVNRLVAAQSWKVKEASEERGQKTQISTYKLWVCNVQHGDYSC